MKIQSQNISSVNNPLNKGSFHKQLEIGEHITAKVISYEKDQAVLQLKNGEKVNALLPSNIEVNDEFIHLEVVGKKDGQVILKMDGGTASKTMDTILETLSKLNIPITEKNIELSKVFLQNHIPISKENMQTVLMTMAKNKEVPLENILFLLQNNIEVNENNLNNIKDIQKGNFSFQSPLENLEQIFLESKNSPILHKIETALKQLNSVLQESISYKEEATLNSTTENISKDNFIGEEIQKQNTENLGQEIHKGNNIKDSIVPFQNLQENRKESHEISVMKNQVSFNEIENLANRIMKGDNSEVKSTLIKNILNLDGEKGLLDLIKDFPQEKEFILEVFKDKEQFKKILENIQEKLQVEGKENPLQNPQKELDSLKKILDGFFLKGDHEVKNIEKLKDLYKEIMIKINVVQASLLEGSGKEGQLISNAMENIENKFHFMEQMNKNYSFLPIPFFTDGNKQSANLYVLKNKKNKNINPNDISAFVSLNTKNIGKVEALVHKVNNTISLQFYVEDKRILSLFQSKISELQSALKNQQYDIKNVFFKILEEPINMINLISEKEEKTKNFFDMKV